MTTDTTKTIIRHLKGITAALENEEAPVPTGTTCNGRALGNCSDEELIDGYVAMYRWGNVAVEKAVKDDVLAEIGRRGLSAAAEQAVRESLR